MDEPDEHPPCYQVRLSVDDLFKQGAVRLICARGLGIVPGDDMVRQKADAIHILTGGEILEGADADVTRGHADEDGARQGGLTVDRFAREASGKRSGGGNPQGRHGFADKVLAQNRPQGSPAVSASREGRPPCSLELDVAAASRGVHDFPQEDCPAIAELRNEVAELVARVCHCDGFRPAHDLVARQERDALGTRQPIGVEPEFESKVAVERDQLRHRWSRGIDAREEAIG
jgi:hypothetical protein